MGTPKPFKALDYFSVETTMVTLGSLMTSETPNIQGLQEPCHVATLPQCIILRAQSHKTVQTHQSVRTRL